MVGDIDADGLAVRIEQWTTALIFLDSTVMLNGARKIEATARFSTHEQVCFSDAIGIFLPQIEGEVFWDMPLGHADHADERNAGNRCDEPFSQQRR